ELLDQDGVVHVVAALAAVLLRVLQPEEPDGGQLLEDLVREPALVLPLLGMGAELRRHEPPHALSELLVLVRERGRRPAGCCLDVHSSTVCPRPLWSKPIRSPERLRRPPWKYARTSAIRPSRNRNHSVPRSSRRSPVCGSRQVIDHSITAWSPSSIPLAICHCPSRFSTAHFVCSPIVRAPSCGPSRV